VTKLERTYLFICAFVTVLFGVGAHYGVKAGPPFSANTGGHAYSSGARGVYIPGGGGFRTSGGSWGGGK
jgi:hypothetical protein